VLNLPEPDWYLDNVLVNARPGELQPAGPISSWKAWWAAQESGEDRLSRLARSQGFVVSTAQLRAHGWADHDLRREVRRGTWWVPGRGCASPVVVTGDDFPATRKRHAIRTAAALLVGTSDVACGPTAAVLHGLPVLSVPSTPVLTVATPDWLGRRATRHLRHSAVAAAQVCDWYGVPVTTVARTLMDVARHDRRSAVMAADAAVREQQVTLSELQTALEHARGWPGIRQARAVIALADGDAESPLESIVRLALHDDGFPPPELQRTIAGYRVDFVWPQHKLILEADGRVKYTNDELWQEKTRETALRRAGYEVERILWRDVFEGWPVMRARLWALIRR
jgi:very-short-patch-repair endonuclease